MRLMIFSDIHGNLEALQRVFADADKRNIHRSICLGDLVGYGPYPNECVELVKSRKNCRCLAGNHDVAALWDTSPYGMSKSAQDAILWTMEQLSDANKKYLGSLPDRIDLFNMTFVHANPYNPRGWRYVMDRKYALRSFAATSCQYLFIGHSHKPLVITRKNFFSIDLQAVSGPQKITVKAQRRHIVNCGSVGQPRDNNPDACYLIFDIRTNTLEYYRVPYDFKKTTQAIRLFELPSSTGRRLLKGT